MRVLLKLGKWMALLFWLLVVSSLLANFAKPFDWLLQASGVAVLLMHALELWLFNARLQSRPRLGLECLQVMLFGIFHLYAVPAAGVTAAEAEHA